MRLGAHMSTAGGAYTAFKRGDETGCETMLIFTKSNRQWQAKPLTDKDIAQFREAAQANSHIFPVAVHASYLINVASPDEALWEKSYQALKVEVERCGQLGIPLLTFHPGSFVGGDEATGLAHIARALRRLLAETAVSAPHVTICPETMAGQGTNLGCTFAQLAWILNEAGPDERLGVCFDTCHVFAAGYDIRTPEAYAATMAEFDRLIGLDRIKFFHFNDSKHELGSNKDRHEHIGRGFIGAAGFANFVNDPRWANHAAHLETPKTEEDEDGRDIEMDPVNLATLRSLIIN
ncbi:MAG: deoxyribonuclease IV [Chloroflexi bacterium]|nr:deoxyribonuclease IV [Chloroflexota bacterium]MBK7917423.1 deoxyribonuclease IV [Chloroflexota bacterium]MBK8933211.1 deoxyribonuclease IV [Chloroflexota bacterium]MBP6804281.1 deoxyribonuclease IV [Chloroflexota bacterium]